MKKFSVFFVLIIIFGSILSACAHSSSANADLYLMAGSNAKLFLGNDYRSEGLLKAFYEETGKVVKVTYQGGPVAETYKDSALASTVEEKTSETTDAFIFDDQLFSKGLKDVIYPARSFVGVWLKKSKAESLGLGADNNYIDHVTYGQLLESGQIKIVTSNANQSTASALEFFATMSACSGNSGAALTVDDVNNSKDCGKRIYDHYARSAGSTSDSVMMVFNDSLQGVNLFDGVVAYQSSFAGTEGLNQKLVDQGKEPFVFVNFSDAAPVAVMAYGNTGNLTDAEKKVSDEFAEFLISEKAQNIINRSGLISGSTAFGVTPDYSQFNADWGMDPNPKVNPVNSPVYNVAKQALGIYTSMYKRAKQVFVCLDCSGSMTSGKVTVSEDTVSRLQGLFLATQKLTQPNDKISLGPNDLISYYLFSKNTVGPVAQSVGPNTEQAGIDLANIIGYSDVQQSEYNDSLAGSRIEATGVVRNGTAGFDCAQNMLNVISQNYDPNVDYYVVLLTDGENNTGIDGDDFYQSWLGLNKLNITLIGISFGTDGSSFNSEYTTQFGGNTYSGNDDAELVEAFQNIFNR